jgi:2-keto-3-deoxy-L-rhamnonate aldolase RhmA
MRENTLKQRLYAGKAAFGVMCTFPAPAVVEMLGYLGFDWSIDAPAELLGQPAPAGAGVP